ncbi:MAG TPA: MJ1477/TM1410 family putative glycoside hydrolase [Stellaceae bacterium]|jgi:uncharacterized protein (TIGR01370 family)|nr:MJ1477/TM1410 family putative glycoside hydrolase [Stellaceae bacterium]
MPSLPFLYQLQNANYNTLSTTDFSIGVFDLDEPDLGAAHIGSLEGQGKILLSYLSIGEAEDYRSYWQDGNWSTSPPSFLLGQDPDWPGDYYVKFWDPSWQQIMFDRVDQAINLGYNGVYLDLVDSYQVAQVKNAYPGTAAQLRQEMVDFVVSLSQYAKALKPGFLIVPQDGVELLGNDDNNPTGPDTAYLNAIDGAGVEDLWYNDNQTSSWTAGDLSFVQYALDANKFVLATSYPTDAAKQADFVQKAVNAHLIPFVGNRELTGVIDPVDYTIAAAMVGKNITVPWGAGGVVVNGTAGPDTLNGGAGNDTLNGAAGNDVLNGGAGADTMAGGVGNDTYVVDNAGDVVTEAAAAGTDTVQSSISYTLGANVENLTLTGSAAINGTGNALNNVIIGNGGNNILNGGAGNDVLNGSAGADTMAGGVGNDTYYVDNAGDIVTEAAAAGTDIVRSSINYTLPANVENLALLGSGNINGTGNSLNNAIIGNGGNNILSGGAGNDVLNGGAGNDVLNGGVGADRMAGGVGNDTYYVDNAGDVVTEAAASGTDIVWSSINYTLPANVENLALLGSGNINGTGNSLNNAIIGNSGNNTLNGGAGADRLNGGAGNDNLYGGAGADAFVFTTPLNASTNVDHIFDFSSIDDKILLSGSVFKTAGAVGTLDVTAFYVGSASHDADDRIIYNRTTGALSYDPDGTGAAAATPFAVLPSGLTLSNTNFQIV